MNRIKDLREDRDLKQKDIAKLLNLSQQQYSRYETGSSLMTSEQLIVLAKFYNVSIDYILYNTDERMPYPKSAIDDVKVNITTYKMKDKKESVYN